MRSLLPVDRDRRGPRSVPHLCGVLLVIVLVGGATLAAAAIAGIVWLLIVVAEGPWRGLYPGRRGTAPAGDRLGTGHDAGTTLRAIRRFP